MSASYLNIERNPWLNHNGTQGAGGCPAKEADCWQMGDGTVFSIKGCTQAMNANVLWYPASKLAPTPNCTNFRLTYDLVVDTNGSSVWARERDLRISDGEYDYNFSCQLLARSDGNYELDISNQSGGWVATGFNVPPLAQGVVHHFVHEGVFNFVQKLYYYELIEIDYVPYVIPGKLQGLEPTKLGWPAGFYLQFQQDVEYQAGVDLGFAEKVANMNLVVW